MFWTGNLPIPVQHLNLLTYSPENKKENSIDSNLLNNLFGNASFDVYFPPNWKRAQFFIWHTKWLVVLTENRLKGKWWHYPRYDLTTS